VATPAKEGPAASPAIVAVPRTPAAATGRSDELGTATAAETVEDVKARARAKRKERLAQIKLQKEAAAAPRRNNESSA